MSTLASPLFAAVCVASDEVAESLVEPLPQALISAARETPVVKAEPRFNKSRRLMTVLLLSANAFSECHVRIVTDW